MINKLLTLYASILIGLWGAAVLLFNRPAEALLAGACLTIVCLLVMVPSLLVVAMKPRATHCSECEDDNVANCKQQHK